VSLRSPVAAVTSPHRPVLLTGWGRTAPTAAQVQTPADAEQVARAVREAEPGPAGRSILARGLGRSYGDAAQSAGGTVLSTLALTDLSLDPRAGLLVAGAGCSLDEILRVAVPAGWFLPVTPGTRQVTLGGAIAADVHGKNHHVDGTFGRYVRWLDLVDGTGTLRRLAPDGEPEARDGFWATVGGLGLTGVVVRAAVALRPVESSWMLVETVQAPDLAALMSALRVDDARLRYTVAWVDVLATGARAGRGVVTSGDHAGAQAVAAAGHPDPLSYRPRTLLSAPGVPVNVVNPLTAQLLSQVWFHKAPARRRRSLEPLQAFFHPLDGVRGWNRLYGRGGFLQYQLAVPDGREDVVEQALAGLRSAGGGAFLGVLKRFGPSNPAPLSFPRPGWTLAVDVPVTGGSRLARVLEQLDLAVAGAGGRLYLVKDSRCRPELVEQMYPGLPRWRAVRDRLDPEHRFGSDLSRRLGL
jgi:decaprenylphospho-beta-D-ribofuranose 2-oxidase